MKPSAIECLGRGMANLRANWELVFVQWVQTVGTVLLIVLGLLPPLMAVGVSGLATLARHPEEWMSELPSLLERLVTLSVPLVFGVLAMIVVWTLAMIFYCLLQAGIFGVLTAGDRQAPPGPARDWRWFRTFSVKDVLGWGSRYLWRFFWFLNLYVLVLSLWLLLVLGTVLAAVYGAQQWGPPAALGIGCGGSLPLFFLLLVTAIWFGLGQADLAREDSGVAVASRRALRVLGGRLGAVVLIYLLMLVAVMAVGAVTMPLSLGLSLGLDDLAIQLSGRAVLMVIEWLLTAIVTIAFSAILVALMRGEDETASGVPAR